MKRMIKLSIMALFIGTSFLVEPELKNVQAVEPAEEITENDLAVNIAISKVEAYLDDYLEEFPADRVESEKSDPKEYLTNKLQADNFTAEEITKIFEIMAENRQKELLALIEVILEEEPFLSKKGLLLKVPADTYSQKEVTEVLELLDIDWKEKAVKASAEYINMKIEVEKESYSIISRKCLRNFLIKEKKFTLEEAIYGIEEAAIDWKEQAFKQAKYYLAADAYSKKGLIEKLIGDEFAKEEAEYGVTETKTNWEEQAMKMAEDYLAYSLLQSKEGLLSYLQDAGFSKEETDYAANLLFQDTEAEELEGKEASVEVPPISVPERPIIIKPIEFVPSQLETSTQTRENRLVALKEKSSKDLKVPKANNIRASQKKTSKVAETEVEEEIEELDDPSLFDSPVFLPVIMVLVVGNLYLFQKS